MGLINKSQVKNFFRKNNMRIGMNFYEALDKELEMIFLKITERASKNKRNTVMEMDL